MYPDGEEYDVVIDTLRQKRDTLWKLTQSNMNCELIGGIGIMDQIRMEQIDQLDKAIKLWMNRE